MRPLPVARRVCPSAQPRALGRAVARDRANRFARPCPRHCSYSCNAAVRARCARPARRSSCTFGIVCSGLVGLVVAAEQPPAVARRRSDASATIGHWPRGESRSPGGCVASARVSRFGVEPLSGRGSGRAASAGYTYSAGATGARPASPPHRSDELRRACASRSSAAVAVRSSSRSRAELVGALLPLITRAR
jgi:hypothetical protein